MSWVPGETALTFLCVHLLVPLGRYFTEMNNHKSTGEPQRLAFELDVIIAFCIRRKVHIEVLMARIGVGLNTAWFRAAA